MAKKSVILRVNDEINGKILGVVSRMYITSIWEGTLRLFGETSNFIGAWREEYLSKIICAIFLWIICWNYSFRAR